jgi:FkbM family methyltransferase
MSENILAKFISRKWLREALGARTRNFINSFAFSPSVIQREVAGEFHQFYLGSPTGKSWYGSAVDPSHEMTFMKREIIKPGWTVIECGAHHGAQTILLSRWVGDDGRVIAIEPIPENVEILRQNIELNELKNVTVVEKAIGNTNTVLSMRHISNGSVAVNGGANTVNVECVTIDKLCADMGLLPDLIKIDVEGFEYQIIEGCENVISAVPALFLEVHTLTLPRYGKKFDDLWDLVNPELYDIYIQSDDKEPPALYSPQEIPNERVHLFLKPRRREIPPKAYAAQASF